MPTKREFSERECAEALAPHIPEYVKKHVVWEPNAGRGDIISVLSEEGFDCWATDTDMSGFNYDLCDGKELDFLRLPFDFAICEEFSSIITRPPFNFDLCDGEAHVRKALEYGVDFVAMLLCSNFNSAASRFDLFTAESGFSFELVLPFRPRWDWWHLRGEEGGLKQSQGLEFSWFVWDRHASPGPTRYAAKGDRA